MRRRANARHTRRPAILPLLFDSADTKYVFRLNGTPWICRGDTFCKPIKIDGVADKDLAQATIEPLGFAGPRYFLSYRQANFEKGKEVALSCTEERCGKLDSTVGDTSLLGTFQVKQGDRVRDAHGAPAPGSRPRTAAPSSCGAPRAIAPSCPSRATPNLYLSAMGSGRTRVAPWRGCATSRAPCCRAPRPRKA